MWGRGQRHWFEGETSDSRLSFESKAARVTQNNNNNNKEINRKMKLEEHTKSGKTHEVRLIDTINYGILLLFHVCFDEMIRKEHKY